MSEKQFTTKNIICSNYCVWDNNDKPYGNDELVILLNEQLSIIRRDELSMKTMMSNIEKLEKENEQLKKDVENLQEVVAELGATLLMDGFEIKINGENLSELIDDE